MHLRNLAAILPFAMLAACGGSGTTEQPTAPEAAPTSQAPATPPETAAPATPAAATAASESAVPAATPVAAAPAEFAICRSCHSPEKGKNGVGPSLFGIVGSKAGDIPDYAFSPALKASGIVWNRDKLDTWLQGPMKMVPGTKMVITVPDAARRKAIIDYLETLK